MLIWKNNTIWQFTIDDGMAFLGRGCRVRLCKKGTPVRVFSNSGGLVAICRTGIFWAEGGEFGMSVLFGDLYVDLYCA